MRRPSFQFYPGDWRNDEQLRLVSLGARGLWIEMMCIMHQAEPYGYLKVGPKVILAENLARLVGGDEGEVRGYLSELQDVGVFSEEEGTIVCRRMIRDERIRNARAEGGKKGGNPALMGHKVKEEVNLVPNLAAHNKDNQDPTPSSSSSSSSSSSDSHAHSAAPAEDLAAAALGLIENGRSTLWSPQDYAIARRWVTWYRSAGGWDALKRDLEEIGPSSAGKSGPASYINAILQKHRDRGELGKIADMAKAARAAAQAKRELRPAPAGPKLLTLAELEARGAL